jgi:hypothetical protein
MLSHNQVHVDELSGGVVVVGLNPDVENFD